MCRVTDYYAYALPLCCSGVKIRRWSLLTQHLVYLNLKEALSRQLLLSVSSVYDYYAPSLHFYMSFGILAQPSENCKQIFYRRFLFLKNAKIRSEYWLFTSAQTIRIYIQKYSQNIMSAIVVRLP